MKSSVFGIALAFTAACTPLPQPPFPQPQSAAEITFIKTQLNAIQRRSIVENREYCGYLGLTPAGAFAISPPERGSLDSCTPDNPPASLTLLASYHTHAAYAPDYDSEAPSIDDLRGDIAEGVNGYIATPGGRLWYNDAKARQAVLLCDIGCLTADPAFRPDPEYPVAARYTLAMLRAR
ncbi:MAG: DUF4329 domain-containing protein [Rhodobacteraceae bacterium]|nr:DUF4329 domain-containing protein [Paracoccaceae bacterium]